MKTVFGAMTAAIFGATLLAPAKAEYPHRVAAARAKVFLSVIGVDDAAVDQGVDGDLNGDGVDDAAILIGRKRDGGFTQQLFVLLAKPDGSYDVAASTQEIEVPFRGTSEIDLEIKQNSLYVTVGGPVTIDVFESDRYQFNWRDGAWWMIGASSTQSYHGNAAGKEHRSDMNLITGHTIETVTDERGKVKTTTHRLHYQKATLDSFLLYDQEPLRGTL